MRLRPFRALVAQLRRKEVKMEIRIEGNQLIIKSTIGSGAPSSSGKTLVVATTNGFVPVEGSNLKVSLNVIKPRK